MITQEELSKLETALDNTTLTDHKKQIVKSTIIKHNNTLKELSK
jgi:hypothetical protein